MMNKEEYTTIKVKIPRLSDLEIKRNVNDSLYSIQEINELIIKDERELYIRELLNRISKARKLIKEIQNFPHTNINQHRYLKELNEILGGKE